MRPGRPAYRGGTQKTGQQKAECADSYAKRGKARAETHTRRWDFLRARRRGRRRRLRGLLLLEAWPARSAWSTGPSRPELRRAHLTARAPHRWPTAVMHRELAISSTVVAVVAVVAASGMRTEDEAAEEDHGDDEDGPGDDADPGRDGVEPRAARLMLALALHIC
jgi:hypothetical protein